jgi:hypothetical protein
MKLAVARLFAAYFCTVRMDFGAKTACKANEIPAQGNALGKW